MDKFGIFNILSSLMSGISQKNGDDWNTGSIPSPNTAQAVESINAEKRANLPPLKNSMLSTMKNHDEFYKRVMKNNPSKQK